MSDGEPREPDRSTDDTELASLLEAYDRALSEGQRTSGAAPHLSPELRQRYESAQSALRLLDQYWRHDESPGSVREGAAEPVDGPGFARQGGGGWQRIGRFEIVRELGQGGGGVVFLAFDPWLGREVALKVPRPDALVSRALRRRFLREAMAAAALDHPNVVRVLEPGEDGPICYLASEYCPGSTLADWLQALPGQVPPPIAAGLVASLADGVEHAHQRGVLHRDIKPSNVLLAPSLRSTSEGVSLGPGLPSIVPKLSDFGLAKVLESEGDDTRTGSPLGTPAYMAPEQAEGRVDSISAATDVYGLGVVLYELLTGRPPFRGTSDLETLTLITSEDPSLPHPVQRQVPGDLQSICLKALEKRPADRYPTAAALADDLRRFLTGRPTEARPLGRLPRAYRWARRRPLHVALAVVSAAAIGLLVSGAVWHHFQIRSSLVEAERMRVEAEYHSHQLRQYIYPGDVQLAYQAWKEGNAGRAREFLARHLPVGSESDLRDFAWHYVWRLCNAEAAVLQGQSGDVYAAAFSPDGSQVVTGASDGTIRWWDARQGTQLRKITAHSDDVNIVQFSPDGRWLSSASDDGLVKIFDATTGELTHTLSGDGSRVFSAAFSPEGDTLVVNSLVGPLRLYDTADWSLRYELSGQDEGELALDCGRNGLLATGDQAGRLQLWDTRQRRLRTTLREQGGAVVAVRISPDGQTLAVAGSDRNISLWNIATGQLERELDGHRNRVEHLSFSPDGRLLASASKDLTARIWNLEEDKLERVIRGHAARLWTVVFSPDGRQLMTTSSDRSVKLWSMDERPEYRRLSDLDWVKQVTAHPDGKNLVLAGDERVLVWNLTNNLRRWEYLPRRRATAAVTISPNGQWLATMSGDGLLQLNHLATYSRPFPPLENPAGVLAGSISNSGQLFAVGCWDHRVYLWNLPAGDLAGPLFGHWAPVSAVQFLPKTDELVSGDLRGEIIITDVASASVRLELSRHTAAISGLASTPDGRLLVSASADGTLKIWNTQNGAELRTLTGHQGWVRALAISPDGHVLATAGDDGTIRLWSLATAHELLAIQVPHQGPVTGLAFANQGQMLLSIGKPTPQSQELYLWEAPHLPLRISP